MRKLLSLLLALALVLGLVPTLALAEAPIAMAEAVIELGPNPVYTGAPVQPEITVTYGDTLLTEGVDYALSFENNVDACEGQAIVTVTGMGGFAGTVSQVFSIEKAFFIGTKPDPVIYIPQGQEVSGKLTLADIFPNGAPEGAAMASFGFSVVTQAMASASIENGELHYQSKPGVDGKEDHGMLVISSKNYQDFTITIVFKVTGGRVATVTHPPVTVTFGASPVPLNPTVTLDGEILTGGSFSWTLPDSHIATLEDDQLLRFFNTGSTNFRLTYTSDDGAITGNTMVAVVVQPCPVTITARDITIQTGDPLPPATGLRGDDYQIGEFSLQLGDMIQRDGMVRSYWRDGVQLETIDTSIPGTYEIRLSGAGATGNLLVQYQSGTLTIQAPPPPEEDGGDTGGDSGSLPPAPQDPTPEPGPAPAPEPSPDPAPVRIPASPAPKSEPETGKSGGWQEIREELEDLVADLLTGEVQPGESITVEMNGATEVPREVLQAFAGTDISVCFDMDGGASWTVNGQDIPADIGGLDLGIETGTATIPVNVVNQVTGQKDTLQLDLSHDGPFGATVHLSLDLDRDNRGFWGNLYYFDTARKELVFQHASRITSLGSASWPFDHASSYAVIIDRESHAPGWENPYTDVKETDACYAAVEFVSKNALMEGLDETHFAPEKALDAEALAYILWQLDGAPERKEETTALDWARDQKLLAEEATLPQALEAYAASRSWEKFQPQQAPQTRAEAARMLMTFLQREEA